MGMSASQARLLSITARLTDNELRSQTITNSKLRLAEKSSEASQEYMNALNSEKLTFRYYNNNGESTSYNLTPALLYSYEPLKNQYSLQNASGQNLVSATDAKNFEESANLSEFLNKYGLVESTGLNATYQEEYKKYSQYVTDYNAWSKQSNDYNKYLTDLANYETAYATWEPKHKAYKEWEVKHAEWEKQHNQLNLAQEFENIVGSSDTATATGTSYCYAQALNGDTNCYTHLLNLLLDYDGKRVNSKRHETSTGLSVSTDGLGGNTYLALSTEQKRIFAQISAAINDEGNDTTRYCDGDDDLSTLAKDNILKNKIDANQEPTDLDKLKSDYKVKKDSKGVPEKDSAGNYQYELKTLKEKAIDMYYIIQNKGTLGVDATTMKNMLINFTEGDMKKINTPEPEEPEKPGDEPQKPTAVADPGKEPTKVNEPTQNAFEFTINDKDKGQWYVNLWYMMNGSESANKIKSSTNSDGETIYGIDDNTKKTSAQNYKVIEDELLTSTDWLQFALKNGIVTLSQASYFNPAEDSAKTSEYTAEGFYWSQKPYTNASDIISVQDDAAIARAEVKYKNATTEIENKDKKYDQDLKKLDTQHNALQTEYESLKNVIDKNVERSFKAFS